MHTDHSYSHLFPVSLSTYTIYPTILPFKSFFTLMSINLMLWHSKLDQGLFSDYGFVANHLITVGLAVNAQLKTAIHSLPESIKFSSNNRPCEESLPPL